MRQCSGDLKEISVNVKNGFLVLQLCINAMHCLREMKAEELSLRDIQAICSYSNGFCGRCVALVADSEYCSDCI